MAKEYNITRASGRCVGCQKELAPGEEYVATVRAAPVGDDEAAGEQLLREDFCLGCWQAAPGGPAPDGLFGLWRARVPQPREKRKTFVDDEVLVSFFERLEGADEEAKVQFRFVLALILMRKKLLVYDRSDRRGDGRDVWTMHLKGEQKPCLVVDPKLDEEKIAQLSGQLGEVLEGEL